MLSINQKCQQETQLLHHQLETLLLFDGYQKKQLANVVQTSVDNINKFLLDPTNANPYQSWCFEVSWLYDLLHKPQETWGKEDWEYEE